MNKKYPEVLSLISKTDDEAIFQFQIESDLFWFQGHFENLPILAGVAQLDWVMMLFHKHFPENGTFSGIQQVKYQQPIFPNENITLLLSLNIESSLLIFEYKNNNNIKSSGKIKLTISEEA